MIINSIEIENFRNIANAILNFGNSLNLLLGSNASGKTNLLEAIYFILTGRSLRGAKETLLVKNGCEYSRLKCTVTGVDDESVIQIGFDGKGAKRLKVNGVSLKRLSRLLSISAVVSVTPVDIEISSGPPDCRRRFIDSLLAQCFPAYLSALNSYGKILKQKNALLKETTTPDKKQLNVWNSQLADYGGYILGKRLQFVTFLSERGPALYSKLYAEESIDFNYKSSFVIKSESQLKMELREALESARGRELRIRQSVVGPHRDDIDVNVDSKSLRDYGSRGQQRCAMLVMKFASLEYMEKMRGEKPLLLLDEAVSELDEGRSANLLELSRSVGQVIMASSQGIENHKHSNETKKFAIERGRVSN
ncbi:MAG: DNA replication/repair protein RecF [candidate division Zixibacteria bacterium]|nr:DNA replication/repair protein RecF [candidate division Zixibacteria bacterium]